MKYFIAILLFFIIKSYSIADCTGNGIYFWPYGNYINQKTIIVIEGYSHSQKVINELNKNNQIYLLSEGEKVNLKVIEINKGEYYLTQALLTIEDNLIEGNDYELIIENLPDYDKNLSKWNPEKKEYGKVIWQATEVPKSSKLNWKVKPIETKKTFNIYGCGDSKYVHFNFEIESESEYLLKTYVTNKSTGNTTEYYLTPIDSTISIGHGMCAGAFEFGYGNEYETWFDVIDNTGNIITWAGNKIFFTKPNEENSLDEN